MSPGEQDEHETLETLFRNIDLSFAKTTVESCFHLQGPGRSPRNPLGIFRAFIVMRMKGVRSLREMIRLLDTDLRIRKLCLLKPHEKGYTRSVLSRFTRKLAHRPISTRDIWTRQPTTINRSLKENSEKVMRMRIFSVVENRRPKART